MKTLGRLAIALFVAALGSAQVSVVLGPAPSDLERLAASELVSHLALIYPAERFTMVDREPATGSAVVFSRMSGPPESFAISGANGKAQILSADARGALFAVYALLEKLGCGFYLSYEATPL